MTPTVTSPQTGNAGLAYNWHRHYDASSGRYIEPDPIGPLGGMKASDQAANLHAYAQSAPITDTDANGLAGITILGPGGVGGFSD